MERKGNFTVELFSEQWSIERAAGETCLIHHEFLFRVEEQQWRCGASPSSSSHGLAMAAGRRQQACTNSVQLNNPGFTNLV